MNASMHLAALQRVVALCPCSRIRNEAQDCPHTHKTSPLTTGHHKMWHQLQCLFLGFWGKKHTRWCSHWANTGSLFSISLCPPPICGEASTSAHHIVALCHDAWCFHSNVTCLNDKRLATYQKCKVVSIHFQREKKRLLSIPLVDFCCKWQPTNLTWNLHRDF